MENKNEEWWSDTPNDKSVMEDDIISEDTAVIIPMNKSVKEVIEQLKLHNHINTNLKHNEKIFVKCVDECGYDKACVSKLKGSFECSSCKAKYSLKQLRKLVGLDKTAKPVKPPKPARIDPEEWMTQWLSDVSYDYRTDTITKPNLGINNPTYQDILNLAIIQSNGTMHTSAKYLEASLSNFMKLKETEVIDKYKTRLSRPYNIDGDREIYRFMQACCDEVNKYSVAVIKHFIWQVKRKVCNMPVYNHIMPIFYGKSGCGKSETVKRLVAPMKDLWMNCQLSDLSDQRHYYKFARGYIQVVEEMQKADRADAEGIKYVITADLMDFRILGHNKGASVKQNATFIGTSNKELFEYINDPTGARRFWEIRCKDRMDWETINVINYDLLWDCVDVNNDSPISEVINEITILQDSLRNKTQYENFIDACIDGNSPGFCKSGDLWNAWRNWNHMNGFRPNISPDFFFKQMGKLLKKYKKRRSDCNGYACLIRSEYSYNTANTIIYNNDDDEVDDDNMANTRLLIKEKLNQFNPGITPEQKRLKEIVEAGGAQ